MKRKLLGLGVLILSMGISHAQTRYVDEIFNESDIIVMPDQPYSLNWQQYAPAAIGGPQLLPNFMDVYLPSPAVDTETNRPVIVYFHTGSFLPKGLAGPVGERTDSAAVEICKRFAKRGFVAISASYRVGWLANSTILDQRRGTNLLAVYKATQDARSLVRALRANALMGGNPLGINEERIILMGQGSGGYITFAAATLDKYSEVADFDKFQYEDPSSTGLYGKPVNAGDPYVDTAVVGDWWGFGGEVCFTGDTTALGLPEVDTSCEGRNYVNVPGVSSDFAMAINLGGALGDLSWLEKGDPVMVSVHVVQDFFAPYWEGMVNVPIGQQFYNVVEVAGSYKAIQKASHLRNLNVLDFDWNDPLSLRARTPSYNPYGIHHILPFDIPPPNPAAPFMVNSNPWDWWDPSDPAGANETNPNSTAQSKAYIDTIFEFIIPRIKRVLDVSNLSSTSQVEAKTETVVSVFPNPTKDIFNIEVSGIHNQILNVEILDVTGKVINRVPGSKTAEMQTSTAHLPNGAYMVRILTNGGILTHKITVAH
ncbi:MAG: T9SS type A sorting domain-containing protein [Cryomorphaceae bacterium]|nr:T9SS type A sorting domain-containing protein [Cryomorphaceae bacterium]